MWESCERMDISWPTGQLTFVARRILANQLRPWNQATQAWLWISGKAWLTRTRKCNPRESFGSIKAVGRMCSGGTSSDSTATKEDVFCNFDKTYLPYCLHLPPPTHPLSIFHVMKRITRRPGTIVLAVAWREVKAGRLRGIFGDVTKVYSRLLHIKFKH